MATWPFNIEMAKWPSNKIKKNIWQSGAQRLYGQKGSESLSLSERGRKNKINKRKQKRESFCRKIVIHEDLTVRFSICLRKRDPCTWIYVSIDCFEVKH